MLIRMAIADTNEEYIDRLRNVLEEEEDLNLYIYTNQAALEDALLSRHFDILLFDESVMDGSLEVDKSTVAVMLLDQERPVPDRFQGYKKIPKYQRISAIYKQCMGYLADVRMAQGEDVLGGRTASCLAFYSPVGGSGKTTLALAAALALSRKGHQVFYLNLEDFASDDCYLPQEQGKGLSELAASLDAEKDSSLKLRALMKTKEERLYYMNHFDSPNDVAELTGPEINELLGVLLRSGFFDYVVVDMSCGLNDVQMTIFENARRIVLVERPDAVAQTKMMLFMKQIHIIRDYGTKMVRVLNYGNGRNTGIDASVPMIAEIRAYQNPDQAHLIEILANGGDGGFVNQIA